MLKFRTAVVCVVHSFSRGLKSSAIAKGHDPFGYTPAVRRKQAAQFIYSLCVLRHGDRTPKHSFPNLKLDEESGSSHAQLTPLGKEQMLFLGKQYRELYDRRGIPLSPEQVFVRSTASPRCKDSAEHFIAGMFGSPAAAPVHTLPLDLDTLLKRHRHNDYESIKQSIYASPEWRQQQDQHETELSLLSDILGVPIALKDANHVHSFFQYMIAHKMPLPTLLTPDLLRATAEMGNFVRRAKFLRRDACVIAGTNLAKDITRRLEQAAQSDSHQQARALRMQYQHGTPLQRFVLYCAHNGTLLSLLGALGARAPVRVPGYASHIRFELWRDANSTTASVGNSNMGEQYSVRVWYDEVEAQIPWLNSGTCSLATLQQVIEELDKEYSATEAKLANPLKIHTRSKSVIETSNDIAAEFEAITYSKPDPYAKQ